jgi:virulence factor Mce-like protein
MPRRSRQKAGRKKGLPALWVALIVIAIPVLITYYAFNRSIPFTSSYTDHAIVGNSVNVRGGDPVRIAGINVGQVTAVEPYGNGTKISFSLNDNGLPIHTDARLAIRDRLFLEGGYYLDLSPGSPSAPIAPEGYTIQKANTTFPVQFYQLLSTFDIAARASLEDLLNTFNEGFSPRPGQALPNSGAGGLKRAIPQLTPVLLDTAWIARALRGTQYGDVQRLLTSSSVVTSTLAGSSSQLVDLVSGLNKTSSALAASDGALSQSIVELDKTLQVAPAALTAIDHSLPPLANLATALTPSLKASPPLLRALTTDINQIAPFITPAARPDLITSLNATLVQFPTILTQLASVFPAIQPVTDCLRTHVVPLLSAKVQDGSLSTNEPTWEDFVHGLALLSGASSDFDANGPYVRALAGTGSSGLQLGTLGSLPIIGQIIGSTTPTGSPIQGSTPAWVGDLPNSVYRPDVSCTSQPVPTLGAVPAASDLRTVNRPPAPRPTATAIRRAIALATRKPGGVG